MKCSRCGNRLVPVEGERTMEFRGRSVTVSARYLQCEGCGEMLVSPRDSTNASQRAADQVRRDEGLLTSSEIRAIRDRLNLTQREFEKLLRVGRNTVARWEAGTVIQSPSIDDKIRGVGDVREFAEYLADLRGVALGAAQHSTVFTLSRLQRASHASAFVVKEHREAASRITSTVSWRRGTRSLAGVA